ncbi:hypothetical protein [Botrimarina sp.]|uniref:hypothetical protein n=1 Tax=Botrimarina sp. TaxID=2795802 RepID=UPI0032EAB16D
MRCTLVGLAALSLAAPAGATTMLFDFGNIARQTALPGWNNVVYTNPDPPPPLETVVDSTGANVPGVSLAITDQFFINGQPSQIGSESPSGDAAAYPVDATDDYFFGHTGPFAGAEDNPTGAITLAGLDQGLAYDFRFFSARNGVNDSRETAFSVVGANSASGVNVTSNNDSEVLSLPGVFPDANGEITVTVSAGPGNDNGNAFYYINVMQVDFIPEPGAATLLALAAGSFVAARRR